MTNPIQNVLSRLKGARPSGDLRWVAHCPAHCDKSPSLSIRETEDGIVLLKCWAGCTAAEIVSAIGISLSDLFPRRASSRRNMPNRAAVEHERMIALFGRHHEAQGTLSSTDRARYQLALTRLQSIGEACDD